VNSINTDIDAKFDNCSKEWICNGCNDANKFRTYNEKYCFDPTIDEAINLQVTIDDMGEFAIFCKEYKLGESVYGDVMYKDGKTITLSKGTGYVYDEIFKEMAFNDTDWEDYTASYISENGDSFDTNFKYYGYRADGQKAAQEIRAKADREATITVATAEKEAQKLKGEGDKKATEIWNKATNVDPNFYSFYRSLEAYRNSFDGDTSLVLAPEGEFFDYFAKSLK
jgi:hypothetical protein